MGYLPMSGNEHFHRGYSLRPHKSVALHLTVVKLTCNENGGPTYSSWQASTHSQEDYHGPHNHILPQSALPCQSQTGQGNIGIHSQKAQRFICHACHTTFSARKGTVFYRLRTSVDTVVIVVTLLAHGCPVQAIVAAFGFDERTVAAGWARSGRQGQAVQEYLVEQPRDLA